MLERLSLSVTFPLALYLRARLGAYTSTARCLSLSPQPNICEQGWSLAELRSNHKLLAYICRQGQKSTSSGVPQISSHAHKYQARVKGTSTRQYSYMPLAFGHKYQTMSDVIDRDKHSSLLQCKINYTHKKFYSTDTSCRVSSCLTNISYQAQALIVYKLFDVVCLAWAPGFAPIPPTPRSMPRHSA